MTYNPQPTRALQCEPSDALTDARMSEIASMATNDPHTIAVYEHGIIEHGEHTIAHDRDNFTYDLDQASLIVRATLFVTFGRHVANIVVTYFGER